MLTAEQRELIRKELPEYTKVQYFDCAGAVMPPLRARRAMEHYIRDSRNARPYFIGAREQLAKLINCPVENVVISSNTGAGISTFVGGFPWKSGDEVLMVSDEYPITAQGYNELGRLGVTIRRFDKGQGGVTTQKYIDAFSTKTRVVALSCVQWQDGARVDLKALCKYAHEHNAFVVIDAMQAIGRLNIDVQDLGVDFLACGTYKGLMCLPAGGFFYMTQELCDLMHPIGCGNESLTHMWKGIGDTLDFLPNPQKFVQGTPNYLVCAGLQQSVGLLNEIGIQNIEDHVLELEDRLRKKTGLKIYGDMPSGIVSIPVDDIDHGKEILKKHNVRVSFRGHFIRSCMTHFTTPEMVDALAAAVNEIYGR